jgi:hypothetical protein
MVKSTKLSDSREFVNCLFYGDGGTGKTTNLAHLANLGRVLYIDAEAGLKRAPLIDMGVAVGNIERLDFDEEGLNFKALEDVFWSIKRDLDTEPDSWVGVCVDSGTEVYHALLESLVLRRVDKAQRLKAQGRSIADLMADRFFVDRDDYGIMSEQVRFLIRRFRDLPCHFGTAFLERRDQDPQDATVRVGPSVTPGLQSDVVGWHDIVGRCTYDQSADIYLGTFKPEGVRQGKDRYGVLPRRLVDPTFDRLVQYVSGELSAEADPRQVALEAAQSQDGKEGKSGSALEKARAKKASDRAGGK